MLHRLIDDLTIATGAAARKTFLVAAAAVSLFATTSFLCAAAFVVVFQKFGLVEACLTGAGIFFVVTLILAGSYFALRKSKATAVVEEARSDAKSAASSFMPDPAMLITGLHIARAIGFRRMLPVIALGGVALGVLAARGLGSTDAQVSDASPE